MSDAEMDLLPAKPATRLNRANAVEARSMNVTGLEDVAIAIASDSLQQRSNLRRVLDNAGLKVVLSEPLTRLFLRKLEKSQADVLLMDLHDDIDTDEQLLHEVLDNVQIPIIFNDVSGLTLNESAADSKWHFNLVRKIAESRGILDWPSSVEIPQPAFVDDIKEEPDSYNLSQALAKNVWVLGASLGGPEALKRFLKSLPAEIPAAFIIAQHLGENFVHLLAEQLDRTTRVNVMAPAKGHVLRNGDVIIAPVDERLQINPIGNLELAALHEVSRYTPSIDMVISDVAERYGSRAGAIIFTGMGDDGRRGCARMLQCGGKVWLQSSESCVISSMPDNVRKDCEIGFTANPEMLARQLIKELQR